MRTRSVELLRAVWAVALLLAPRVVLCRVLGLKADPRALLVARILGAR